MFGRGPHKVASGQVTDDSEMSMCVLWGLVNANKNSSQATFDFELIADQYRKWYESNPFDIGETTERAVAELVNGKAKDCIDTVNEENHGKSNGSLMRMTPTAIFGSALEAKEDKW